MPGFATRTDNVPLIDLPHIRSEAEVGDDHRVISSYKNVRRFQVAMHNSLCMNVVEAAHQPCTSESVLKRPRESQEF